MEALPPDTLLLDLLTVGKLELELQLKKQFSRVNLHSIQSYIPILTAADSAEFARSAFPVRA